MKIEIKYSTSEGPHLVNISMAEINQMIASHTLVVTQPTPKGEKTITFVGTKAELAAMATAFSTAT